MSTTKRRRNVAATCHLCSWLFKYINQIKRIWYAKFLIEYSFYFGLIVYFVRGSLWKNVYNALIRFLPLVMAAIDVKKKIIHPVDVDPSTESGLISWTRKLGPFVWCNRVTIQNLAFKLLWELFYRFSEIDGCLWLNMMADVQRNNAPGRHRSEPRRALISWTRQLGPIAWCTRVTAQNWAFESLPALFYRFSEVDVGTELVILQMIIQ